MTTDRTPRNGSMRRAATTLAVMISLTASLLATAATPAQAVGSYANSTIADVALRYLNQWGGNACRDAGKYQSGQCKQFVNCVVFIASGGTQYPAGGYSSGFAASGGQEIIASQAVRGDIIQVGESDTDYPLHTAIVLENKGGGVFYVVDSNAKYVTTNNEWVTQHTYTPPANARYWRMGTVITDRDGDGTPDASDSCPDEPGPASNGGCPEHIWLPGDSVSTRCGFSNNGGLYCTRLEQGVWVTRASGAVDRGYPSDRKWLVNRDGSISYCSTVGTGTSARCDTLRNGQWTSSVSAPTDLGYAGDRAWLASAQGPAECGRAGNIDVQTVVCNVLTSTGWVRTTAPTPGDWGYPSDRKWLVNRDGSISYCSTVGTGTSARCDTLRNGQWTSSVSAPTDLGYAGDRAWLASAQGPAECGRAGNIDVQTVVCNVLTSTGWVRTTAPTPGDWGYPSDRKWLVNRDGSISYCSTVGTGTSARCDTLRNGQWTSSVSAPTDLGYAGDRAWLASAQGPAECGRAGSTDVQTVVCNVLTSTGWVRTAAPTPGDWGYPSDRKWIANNLGTLSHCKTVGDGTQLRCDTLANLGWSTTDPATSVLAPTKVDGCGTAKDTYTIPAVTGVEYLAGGVVKAPGTYPTSGATSLTITARAKPGYALTGTTTWTLTWTTTACTTTVTGNALSTPTWTLPKATLTWAATGAPAGTTLTYDVQFRAVTLSTTGTRLYSTPTTWYTHTTTKTGTISGSAGGVYQVQARTTDQYGTIGAWSPWTTVTMPIDDRATSFAYTGTWTAGNSTSYYGGTYKLTSTPAAKVTVTAWTDQVSVIGARSTTSGKATITIDGVLKATIDTYGATAVYRQTLATITVPYGKHTITITNLATTGRPRLILDALAFRR